MLMVTLWLQFSKLFNTLIFIASIHVPPRDGELFQWVVPFGHLGVLYTWPRVLTKEERERTPTSRVCVNKGHFIVIIVKRFICEPKMAFIIKAMVFRLYLSQST